MNMDMEGSTTAMAGIPTATSSGTSQATVSAATMSMGGSCKINVISLLPILSSLLTGIADVVELVHH